MRTKVRPVPGKPTLVFGDKFSDNLCITQTEKEFWDRSSISWFLHTSGGRGWLAESTIDNSSRCNMMAIFCRCFMFLASHLINKPKKFADYWYPDVPTYCWRGLWGHNVNGGWCVHMDAIIKTRTRWRDTMVHSLRALHIRVGVGMKRLPLCWFCKVEIVKYGVNDNPQPSPT